MLIRRLMLAALLSFGFAHTAHAIVNGTVVDNSGTPPTQTLYPWMVSVHNPGSGTSQNTHICGGTLINSQFVLTAAHCVLNGLTPSANTNPPNNFYVTIGGFDRSAGNTTGRTVEVTKVFVNPNYQENPTLSYDVALLRLASPVNDVTPITLAQTEPTAGTGVTAIGWGATAYQGAGSIQLRQVDTNIASRASCESFVSSLGADAFTASQICATKSTNGGICQGDSGGPLFFNDGGTLKQVGISSYVLVSGGNACGRANIPDYYANVAFLYSYIMSNSANYNIARFAATPNQRAVANAMDSSVMSNELESYYQRLFNTPVGQLPATFESLLPTQVFSQLSFASISADVRSMQLGQRMNQLRSRFVNSGSVRVYGVDGSVAEASRSANRAGRPMGQMLQAGQRPQFARSGRAEPVVFNPASRANDRLVTDLQQWGWYVMGDVNLAEDNKISSNNDTDITTYGLTMGADRRLGRDSFAGGALSVAFGETDNNAGQKVDHVNTALTAYFTTGLSTKGWLNSYFSLGLGRYKSERTIRDIGGNRLAEGTSWGQQVGIGGEAGYRFAWRNPFGRLLYGPIVGAYYTYNRLGSFTEDNAGDLGLEVDSTNFHQFRLAAGAEAAYQFFMGSTSVSPFVRAMWQQELGSSNYEVNAAFLGGRGRQFTIRSGELDQSYLTLAPGVNVEFTPATSLQFGYSTDLFRDDFDNQTFNASFRRAW